MKRQEGDTIAVWPTHATCVIGFDGRPLHDYTFGPNHPLVEGCHIEPTELEMKDGSKDPAVLFAPKGGKYVEDKRAGRKNRGCFAVVSASKPEAPAERDNAGVTKDRCVIVGSTKDSLTNSG